jgi:amidase
VEPMVGVIGCAPLLGGVTTMDNGTHGGNLDVQEIGPGCRVILPVEVDGALFALGDCHARQGDGELCGLGAIECRTNTTVRLDLAPRPEELRWPRLETATHLATVACARPLEDAFRIAVRELVAWLGARCGLSVPDAVMLLGQVAEARATQIVNPKYTYVVKIAKRWLPPGADLSDG